MRAITDMPANTPNPIGRTCSFFPGIWNAAAGLVLACSAAAVPVLAASLDVSVEDAVPEDVDVGEEVDCEPELSVVLVAVELELSVVVVALEEAEVYNVASTINKLNYVELLTRDVGTVVSLEANAEVLPALLAPGVAVAWEVSVDVLATEAVSEVVGVLESVEVAVPASVVDVGISVVVVADKEVESVGEALSVGLTVVESVGAGDVEVL